ncbi:hypothetical protein ACWV2X_07975 [Streptomyces hydrogenans]
MTDDSTEAAQESQQREARDPGAGRHRGSAAPVDESSSAPHGRHRREGDG